jgi:hypothetical protein
MELVAIIISLLLVILYLYARYVELKHVKNLKDEYILSLEDFVDKQKIHINTLEELVSVYRQKDKYNEDVIQAKDGIIKAYETQDKYYLN